jgi:hypothetical protein
VLKDGEVVEMGSHRELLDLEGIYSELWNGKYKYTPVISRIETRGTEGGGGVDSVSDAISDNAES